jgi:hypothetical protein
LGTICLGWSQIAILLISASQVASEDYTSEPPVGFLRKWKNLQVLFPFFETFPWSWMRTQRSADSLLFKKGWGVAQVVDCLAYVGPEFKSISTKKMHERGIKQHLLGRYCEGDI